MDVRVYRKNNGESYVFSWDGDCLSSFRSMLLMMDFWMNDPELSFNRHDARRVTGELWRDEREFECLPHRRVILESFVPTAPQSGD